jgi:hypothetical protein
MSLDVKSIAKRRSTKKPHTRKELYPLFKGQVDLHCLLRQSHVSDACSRLMAELSLRDDEFFVGISALPPSNSIPPLHFR